MSSLLRTVLVLVTVGWTALLGASPAMADDLVKVFVVTDAGQTLPSIAASTLGDQRRSGEILDLNRGRPQPDGGTLNSADEPLHKGWVLRLPQDASGPDVRLARETGSQSQPQDQDQDPASGTTSVTFPLAAALAIVGSVLLALITVAIVSRRQVGALLRRVLRAITEPGRRRRRLADRRALGERFAADGESLRRGYDTAGHEPAVHAIQPNSAGVAVWLSPGDSLAAPWERIDSTRWRRDIGSSWRGAAGPTDAFLVRAGADATGDPLLVDLSRLDGVLSVTGDRQVAREVVQNLLGEVAHSRPGTPVLVLPAVDGSSPLVIPGGLQVVPQMTTPPTWTASETPGPLRGAAVRGPVRGLVVLAGDPDEQQLAALLALCGSRGAGWTGLVCGEAGESAHWRWTARPDGSLEIPVLGLELTVPL